MKEYSFDIECEHVTDQWFFFEVYVNSSYSNAEYAMVDAQNRCKELKKIQNLNFRVRKIKKL